MSIPMSLHCTLQDCSHRTPVGTDDDGLHKVQVTVRSWNLILHVHIPMLVGVECHNNSCLRDLLPSLVTYIPTTERWERREKKRRYYTCTYHLIAVIMAAYNGSRASIPDHY